MKYMIRKKYWTWCFSWLTAGCLIVQSALISAAEPQDNALQNVVVILADDHALGVTGAYGNRTIHTPALDNLSKESLTFSQAYCNSPICSASRQSMLTGKYPHATGVNLLFTPFPDEGNTTIAEHLKPFGFRTALIGKDHWNNWAWGSLYKDGLPDHGFETVIGGGDYRRFYEALDPEPLPNDREYYQNSKPELGNMAEWMNYRVLPHPVRDEDSSGTYYANQAIEFMRKHQDERFFVWLAFKEPHHPYYFPVEYAGKYDPEDMPLPKGSPEDDRWIPERFRGLSDTEKRGIIASYYTSTEYLDKNVGLVLDALDTLNLSENTIVIYASDNGYLLNDHKRFEKHTMWEEAIHQPLFLRPGRSLPEKHITTDALVEYVDIVPTLLDLLDIDPLIEVQGVSFAGLLENPSGSHRDSVFSTYLQDNLAMIRTKEWKYVFHTGNRDLSIGYATGYGPSGIFHGLYDLTTDPDETHNVAHDPSNAEVLRSLQSLMLQRFYETHPDAANCPEGLSAEGKLVWFCEPRDIGYDQEPDAVPSRVFQP